MALTTVPASLSATALTLTTAAQPNITSVGTLTGLTVSGNIAGTLTTAAQTNITSLGTLSALTVTGTSTLGVVDASSFTDVITNTIYTQSSNLDIDVVLSGRDVTFTQGSTALMTVKGDASGTTVTGTLTGSDILLVDSGTTERSIRIQNSAATAYFGVEGPSANRFVGSAANNMFLGTTTADGIQFATNNNVRAVIDSSGNVGIGTTTPGYKLEVNGTAHVVNTLTAGAIGIPSQGITLNQAFGTGVPSITMTGTANNGRAGAINFKESDGSGGAIANTAAIYSTDGAGGNANYGGLTIATYQSDLKFATSALASTRMTIDSSGRVSFGPDAADIQIDPASTNSNNNIIYMRGNTTGDKSEIQLNHYGYADYHIGVGHVANGTFNISNDQTGKDFVIDTSGRVGINKSTPSAKLHVVSTGSASYDSTSAGSNIGMYLGNEESGAANRTIGIGLVCESNGEIYLNAVTNSINNGADFYLATRHAGTRRRRFQIMSDGRQINQNSAIVTTNECFLINMGFMPHAAAYGSGTTSGRYLHMKLTQPAGGVSASGVNVMGRYEYKGFAYGGGFIDCGCSFYTYVGTSTPYAFYSNNQGHGNGMSAYYSSDNKVVIVVDIIANNYSGGILYFQAGSTHYITDNQVASINYSANTTGVF